MIVGCGDVGLRVVQQLAALDCEVTALIRDPKKAESLRCGTTDGEALDRPHPVDRRPDAWPGKEQGLSPRTQEAYALDLARFAESFRLHHAMAEFLREEIYRKDGIDYLAGLAREVSRGDMARPGSTSGVPFAPTSAP